MTEPQPHRWGSTGLMRLATSFTGQEHTGVLGGLLLRLARFLGGDPALYVLVTSTGTGNPQGLPDSTTMQTAVLHVQGNPIAYRVDGGTPNPATDAIVQVGSVLTLTGFPTMKGFQFCSTVAAPATLVGAYYD